MAEFSSSDDFINSSAEEIALIVEDAGRRIVRTNFTADIKELICSLLAGNGFLLPNLQTCIMANLQGLIDQLAGFIQGQIQQLLQQALSQLMESLNAFMQHMSIDNVLSRLNSLGSQLSQVANMINFCAAPISPIPITNVLENAMQSLLGKGLELLNRIGSIPTPNLGGCLGGGGFNSEIFDGGVLRAIGDNLDIIIDGTVPENTVTVLVNEIVDISNGLETLIAEENCVQVTEELGGSSFFTSHQDMHDGVGVFHNPESIGFSGNVRVAFALKSAFDNLAGYPVVDNEGNTHKNIFELFVDDVTMDMLRRDRKEDALVQRRTPVYDYCGTIIGYTTENVQGTDSRSLGDIPYERYQPGHNANGMDTSGGNNPCYTPPETSDIRFKENIQDINNPIEIVKNLEGKYFNFKGQSNRQVGVIAQQVEEHLPEIVEEDGNGVKMVKYGNTVGVLIEAMKAQQEQIDSLKSQVDTLTKALNG